MKKQPKKLTLNKETLRDLTTPKAGEVKGGGTEVTCTCVFWTYYKHCMHTYLKGHCH